MGEKAGTVTCVSSTNLSPVLALNRLADQFLACVAKQFLSLGNHQVNLSSIVHNHQGTGAASSKISKLFLALASGL
jgi:hypothetical protein